MSPSARETALITGASSGIGAELARCFARGRSDVILLARTESALAELAEELEAQFGITATVHPADLSEPGAAEEVATALEDDGHTVDVLVNNAGFGARGRFDEIDAGRQVDMVQVNVTALMHLTRLLVPGMRSRGRGGVLNVASTAAFQPGPYMNVYYATKAFVLSFSEGLTEEMVDTPVTVTCLAPGPTETPFMDRAGLRGARLFDVGAVMPASAVALAGYDGFRAGESLVIPGAANAFAAFMTRFLPRAVTRKIAAALQGV